MGSEADMAYYTSPSRGGGYSFESDASTTPDVQAKPLSKLANIAGAAMSVALIIGIAVWGYKLLMRDVTGIRSGLRRDRQPVCGTSDFST